ncbi:flagellar assembly protein FliH [Rummeliibacillus sp. JY-2-4R]
MTSLSRIIRFDSPESSKEKFRTIEIKDLNFQNDAGIEEVTPQNILEEREQLINEAIHDIQMRKESFEQQCLMEKQALEEEKNNWQEEKIILQQQAYEEAFQQGLEEGRLKAEANMSEAIQQANETIAQSKKNADLYLQEQETIILDLAIRSAERILGSVLREDHERYIDIVRRGLKEAREMKEIKLYVSTTYYQLVSEHRESLSEMFPIGVPLMIFVNEEWDETDCYIETNHGRIVVSIDQQLNELKLKLLEILESGS